MRVSPSGRVHRPNLLSGGPSRRCLRRWTATTPGRRSAVMALMSSRLCSCRMPGSAPPSSRQAPCSGIRARATGPSGPCAPQTSSTRQGPTPRSCSARSAEWADSMTWSLIPSTVTSSISLTSTASTRNWRRYAPRSIARASLGEGSSVRRWSAASGDPSGGRHAVPLPCAPVQVQPSNTSPLANAASSGSNPTRAGGQSSKMIWSAAGRAIGSNWAVIP